MTDGQTDRRTDRPTSCDGIVRAMHTRRAVKINCSSAYAFKACAVNAVLTGRVVGRL